MVVRRDTDANVFNDKQTITADPTAANLVYGVWDRLVFPSSEARQRPGQLSHLSASGARSGSPAAPTVA